MLLDVDERVVGDAQQPHLAGQRARSSSSTARGWRRCGRRPWAASAICWIRWMWLAKQVDDRGAGPRGRGTGRRARRRPSVSDARVAGLVGVGRVARAAGGCPRSGRWLPMQARSVRRPSTGVRSSFQSPVCRIVPCGVWKAVAKPCGTEWVTGRNSTSNGPIWRRSPSATGMNSVRSRSPASSMRLRARPSVSAEPIDRERQLPQQERQPADVVLVAVGGDAADDPVGVLPQVGEVGQHEVDARHVGVREEEPAVEQQDLVVDLDAGAVAPDLAQPAEERDS